MQPAEHLLGVGAREAGPLALRLGQVELVVVVGHQDPYLSLSRLATGSGTMLVTSPPKRAMSRMSLDATAELADADGRNSVCTPDTLRFICAWEISLSKSIVDAQALDDEVGPDLRGQVDDELGEADDLDVVEVGQRLA